MTTKEAITWFKQTFISKLKTASSNTPYSIDLLCAMAFQETGYIWSNMAGKLSLNEIAMLAVGDTLDMPKRNAFPKNKAALVAEPNGDKMFTIARDCLIKMSAYVKGYEGAVNNPAKFCHGFGIFQYDLQFFKTNPQYFLQKKWADIDPCFTMCIEELNAAKERQGWKGKTILTDDEKVYVAIAYNKGTANLSKGFKQGYFDGKKFYGENIFEYMRLSQSVAVAAEIVTDSVPAPLPLPTPVLSNKKIYKIKVASEPLNLRGEPKIPRPNPRSNVKVTLPNGHLVSWLAGKPASEWFEVETNINGAYFKGFVASKFLELVKDNTVTIPLSLPAIENPTTGAVAVYMPRKAGTITKRSEPANASSLNEPGQPLRSLTAEPLVLKAELVKIADWLNVEKTAHKRYQPGNGSTFCNVYAHDFCYLAGAYFPRVWWTQSAIIKLTAGETVTPLLGNTIEEIRANNLLRWLKDFGESFGWRQTGDITKLQNAANIGGVSLIIARRIEEGKSGHVTIVLPENINASARRDNNGNVTAPLQSQAGSVNFKMSTGKAGWWLDQKFAEHSFWIHG
jgi:hypothetical protein